MNETLDIEEKKSIWVALSELYLDTELGTYDYTCIASTILESPYTFEEVKTINKYEVFPVLQPNLLIIPGGVWSGFNAKWVVQAITGYLKKKNAMKTLKAKLFYYMFKGMHKDEWVEIEKIYNAQKNKL